MAKEVFVVRHAEKDRDTKQLTSEGRAMAKMRGEQLGKFSFSISTSKPRARETAYLMTGQEPIIDERAGMIEFTEEQERRRACLESNNPNASAEAVYEDAELRSLFAMSGQLLVALLQDVLQKLPEGEQALVVSHKHTIVDGERILIQRPLTEAEMNCDYLQGFKVNEQLEVENI